MNNHCDLLLDYFNGTLTDTEKQEFEQHLKQCRDCREELDELQELTADLPYASEPVNPPEGMKERVLANVFSEESDHKENEKSNVAAFPQRNEQLQRPEPSVSKKWITPLLAASLMLSLLGNAYTIFNESEPEDTEQRDVVANTLASVQLSPVAMENSSGSATMVRSDDGMNVIVQVNNVQELDGEKAYQVWLLDGGKPYRAGTFVPNENGQGGVAYSMTLDEDHSWDQIAITLEPTPHSQKPQGDIVLASKL